jgi:putative transposase
MMAGKIAERVKLSEKQKEILEAYARGSHVPLNLKTRAQIVIKASTGESTSQISRTMEIGREQVSRWRVRYIRSAQLLTTVETEEPRKLKQLITNILSDEQRAGSPTTFTAEQKASIIALACMNPEELGLPFSHWTPTLLQIEAINRKIIKSISTTHIGRFLKSGGIETSPSKDMVESKHRK